MNATSSAGRPFAAATGKGAWSPREVHALGATTDLVTAASVLRIGRTKAYQLAKTGEFPVPVIHTGRRYMVAVAHLLRMLGLDTSEVSMDLPFDGSGASMPDV